MSEKLEKLKESVITEGVWKSLITRPRKRPSLYQEAFGHHSLLSEEELKEIEMDEEE